MNFFANLFGNNNSGNNRRDRPRSAQQPRGNQSNARSRPAPSEQRQQQQRQQQRQQQQQQQQRQQQRQQQPQQQQQQQPERPRQQRQPQEDPPDFDSFRIPAGMEHIFAHLFAQTGYMPEQFQEQFAQQMQQQESSNAPPPASNSAIRKLPIVTVTPEDLVDENNRECCICFEPHELGDKVVRLPCAHIFHPECITEWLTKHCTCPICRYELPTSNPTYESSRRERMATRKPRYARHELDRMKISDLLDLCQNKLRIPVAGNGYTKQEVIDLIISSGKIDIIVAPPPMEIKNVSILRDMGVGKLKRTMREAGVFFDSRDVIEKEDMVQIFINSGRVVFKEEITEEEEEEHNVAGYEIPVKDYHHYGDIEHHRQDETKRARLDEEGSRSSGIQYQDEDYDENDNKGAIFVEEVSTRSLHSGQSFNNDAETLYPSDETSDFGISMAQGDATSSTPVLSSASAPASAPAPSSVSSTAYSINESADITTRSVGELRQLARALGVDITNCLEKREMIELIVNAMTRSGTGVRFGGGVVS